MQPKRSTLNSKNKNRIVAFHRNNPTGNGVWFKQASTADKAIVHTIAAMVPQRRLMTRVGKMQPNMNNGARDNS